jgi:hypothetical protein
VILLPKKHIYAFLDHVDLLAQQLELQLQTKIIMPAKLSSPGLGQIMTFNLLGTMNE